MRENRFVFVGTNNTRSPQMDIVSPNSVRVNQGTVINIKGEPGNCDKY